MKSILSAVLTALLNLEFWIVAPLLTAIFALFAVPYAVAFNYTVRDRRRTLRLIRRSISYYGAMIVRCGWPLVRVRFVDHAPGETPPFVFTSNHRSSSDAFLMGCLPFECIQALNIWPSRLWVVGRIGRIAGYLKVREMPFEQFLADGSKLLAEGCSIIVFPEGTRSGSRRLGPFHGAAFRLAQQCGANVVPIAICGNERIPPRGSLLLRPGRIIVNKLPAITPGQYAGLTPYKLKNLARDAIRQHLDNQSGV
jgi:1-acyl-sn-glycerol-3-phosphate acyltransferase